MRDASGAGPRLRYLSADDAAGKRDILTAALHLFVRDGLCETTIRDIAKSAGYSNPVLFKHFDSKDHLALVTVGWLGILQQFGREWYFGDFKGKAIRHRQQLEELLLRMAETRGRQS